MSTKSKKKSSQKNLKKVNKSKKMSFQRAQAVSHKHEIIQLILADHRPLKKLIKILKETENPIAERQAAFEEFADVLSRHSYAEEHSLYKSMEKADDLREQSFEGEVEHNLCDEMLQSIKSEQDKDMWSAKVKVIAELVEHHVKEEERDMLPDVRKLMSLEKRLEIGDKYQELKKGYLTHNTSQAPVEESEDESLGSDESAEKTQPTTHH